MKCARLHLQERSKPRINIDSSYSVEKPRRYCQKRLINPKHEEDPRWIDVFERFHCNEEETYIHETLDSSRTRQDSDELVLSVQTLKFQGDENENENKRPKTSFKFKTSSDTKSHRMFIKQVVPHNEFNDDDRSSQLTCYYFDDYVKYLFSNDRSRPTSGKSSIFLRGLSNKFKDSKATQVDSFQLEESKKNKKEKIEAKVKNLPKQKIKADLKQTIMEPDPLEENTKISYHKTGKRKSLTISRTQSPETVQVIRVDVVCNNNSATVSDYEDCTSESIDDNNKVENADIGILDIRKPHFANKYLLTNTIKTLEENLSGGAKVTLLCKTFRLADRMGNSDKSKGDKKYVKVLKTTRDSIITKTNKLFF